MKPGTRFLLLLAGAYVLASAVGLLLFKSPNFSQQYLSENEAAHERFVGITSDPAFQLFEERPHLYAREDPRHEQLAFVQAYRARPEYRRERLRIEAFTLWFHFLNGMTFLALVVRFGYRPTVDYLDSRVREIREQLAKTSQMRTAAMHHLAEMQAEVDLWPEKEAVMKARADDTINSSLTQISEEARLARIQLARETEDRKNAELHRVAALIKQELVSQAIDKLQARYVAEESEAGLRERVDQFVRLLELIA